MSSYSRQKLEEWVKTIKVPDGSHVLDVGGSQLPIKDRLVDCGKDCEFKILDLEQPHEEMKKPDIVLDLNDDVNIPLYEIGNFEEKQNKLVRNSEEYFDVAFCLEVSEYWWNPVKALENINYFLKKGGKLYISFHFIYPVHNPVEQDYMRYTLNGAEKLLQETGFKIDKFGKRGMKNFNRYWEWTMLDEKMRPAKGYDCHNWTGCLLEAVKV